MTRPRLLYVSEKPPWPKDSGGNIRTYYLVEALARHYDLTLLSTDDGSPTLAEGRRVLEGFCSEVEFVPDTKQRGGRGMAWGVLASLLHGRPAVLQYNENPHLRAAAERRLTTGSYDFLHLSQVDTSVYFDLAATPTCVIDTQNVLFEYYERRAEHEQSALRRWACRREGRLLRRFEPELFASVASTIVCSEEERETLHAVDASLSVEVIPNGVDCDYFETVDVAGAAAPADLIFVGDMGYGPNQDACEFFIEDVLPLVRARVPEARFLAVGKNPSQALRDIGASRDEVIVTGFVDDVRDWLRKAGVYVVPIRYGSGTRLKVLEAFASGLPTVSTSIGAEGIDYTRGSDIEIADEPEALAAAICGLIEDRTRAAQLGRNARMTAESRYAWPAIGARMVALHESLSE